MQRGLIPLIASHSESRVDLIPSDFVADWISDAVRQPYLAGVYQLTPGRQALKTDRLVELVTDEFRAFDPAWHNGQVLPPQLVSAEMFEQFRKFVADSKDALFTTILESTDSFLPSLLYPRVYRNQRAMSVSRSLERLDRTLLEQTVRRVLQRCIANNSVANPLGAEK
jgi:hypothetical protein